jgi:hypothetical protein
LLNSATSSSSLSIAFILSSPMMDSLQGLCSSVGDRRQCEGIVSFVFRLACGLVLRLLSLLLEEVSRAFVLLYRSMLRTTMQPKVGIEEKVTAGKVSTKCRLVLLASLASREESPILTVAGVSQARPLLGWCHHDLELFHLSRPITLTNDSSINKW